MTEETKKNEILDTMVDYELDALVTLREAIQNIPGDDGWWKSHSGEVYEKAAVMLCENGLSPQDSLWHLHSMYWSAAACYGG